MGFNISITFIGYDCNATLKKAFFSWREIKLNKALSNQIDNLYISAAHVCFPETESLGYNLYSSDGTIETLQKLKDENVIDALTIYNKSIEEQIAWSNNLNYFPANTNLVWMLNGDEIWTLEEISNTLDFIQRNPLTDFFKINFKNYFGRNKYVKDFIVPRIWSNNRNEGVKRFYRDDLVEFNNGKKDVEVSHMVVPSHLCFPAHYSWSLPSEYSDEENYKFVNRKLLFQKLRYSHPSYKWNIELDQLELDSSYYARIGKPIPEIFYEN